MNKKEILIKSLWRISIIIYIPLTTFLMITILPIKWIFTGEYKFTSRKLYFLDKWFYLIFYCNNKSDKKILNLESLYCTCKNPDTCQDVNDLIYCFKCKKPIDTSKKK